MEVPLNKAELLSSLQELIEALDRRVPQLERIGEAKIAADAQQLRARAMRRIARLTQRSEELVAPVDE